MKNQIPIWKKFPECFSKPISSNNLLSISKVNNKKSFTLGSDNIWNQSETSMKLLGFMKLGSHLQILSGFIYLKISCNNLLKFAIQTQSLRRVFYWPDTCKSRICWARPFTFTPRLSTIHKQSKLQLTTNSMGKLWVYQWWALSR